MYIYSYVDIYECVCVCVSYMWKISFLNSVKFCSVIKWEVDNCKNLNKTKRYSVNTIYIYIYIYIVKNIDSYVFWLY